MENRFSSLKGFNLIELVITIAVVVILASIAIPSYIDYNRRTYYGENLATVKQYKDAVVVCYERTKKLKGCDGGTHLIPANITSKKEGIASLTVKDGKITVIPVSKYGVLTDDHYILTPSISNKTIVWMPSGKAIDKGYLDK